MWVSMMTNAVLRRICTNFQVHTVVQNFYSMMCMVISCRTVPLAQLGISFYTLDSGIDEVDISEKD